jgi:RNA polymerase sigma-B factor
LLKGLNKYDSRYETSFVTYASHCIMGEIRHFVRKEASFYRPGYIVKLQRKVDQIIVEYAKAKRNVPSPEYIAEKLRIRVES